MHKLVRLAGQGTSRICLSLFSFLILAWAPDLCCYTQIFIGVLEIQILMLINDSKHFTNRPTSLGPKLL